MWNTFPSSKYSRPTVLPDNNSPFKKSLAYKKGKRLVVQFLRSPVPSVVDRRHSQSSNGWMRASLHVDNSLRFRQLKATAVVDGVECIIEASRRRHRPRLRRQTTCAASRFWAPATARLQLLTHVCRCGIIWRTCRRIAFNVRSSSSRTSSFIPSDDITVTRSVWLSWLDRFGLLLLYTVD